MTTNTLTAPSSPNKVLTPHPPTEGQDMDIVPATPTAIPIVGDEAFGGIVVGRVEPPNEDGWLLIAAPKSIDTDGWKWQTSTDDAPNQTRNPYDGLRATEAMVRSAKRFPAAEWCAGLDSPRDGGSDWYLPSRHELWLMTLALMGTDDQLKNDWYWSATESSASYACYQRVGGSLAGYQYVTSKTYTRIRVRPVRRVALSTFTFLLSSLRESAQPMSAHKNLPQPSDTASKPVTA